MPSPISLETHKTYSKYTSAEASKILKLLAELSRRSSREKALYHGSTYQRHVEVNTTAISQLMRKAKGHTVNVPADILFWLQRSCKHFSISPPVKFPHICKLKIAGVEHFFATNKEDWLAHKNATAPSKATCNYTDHAKLGYLTRVAGLDVDALMLQAPMEELLTLDGEALGDGRRAVKHGNHTYILQGETCISVLTAGMSVQ